MAAVGDRYVRVSDGQEFETVRVRFGAAWLTAYPDGSAAPGVIVYDLADLDDGAVWQKA